MNKFLSKLESTIAKRALLSANEQVLIGVSGGPDSMALLHGLQLLSQDKQKHWRLSVVHVHHHLRGADSDADAEYVATYCEQNEISCVIKHVDVLAIIQQTGGNTQAVARQLRYDAFAETAQELGITKLALAHHADDQVETILMRLLRGTGVSGLAGMELVRAWRGLEMIRPMLDVSREDVEAYIAQMKLQPRLDESNQSTKYTRNRIRLQLVPELETYNARVKASLLQLAELSRAEEEVWQQLTKNALEKVLIEQKKADYRLDVKKFLDLPVALQRRTVKLILDCLYKKASSEVSLETVDRVRRCAAHTHTQTQTHVAGGILVTKEYQQLQITYWQDQPIQMPDPVSLIIPGITKLSCFHGEIEAILTDARLQDLVKQNHNQVVFDAKQITEPLVVRARQAGDRMSCFGFAGSKKVKDLLMEAKVPPSRRDSLPLVEMAGQIIWIPGVRRSAVAPVTQQTDQVLYLAWRRQA